MPDLINHSVEPQICSYPIGLVQVVFQFFFSTFSLFPAFYSHRQVCILIFFLNFIYTWKVKVDFCTYFLTLVNSFYFQPVSKFSHSYHFPIKVILKYKPTYLYSVRLARKFFDGLSSVFIYKFFLYNIMLYVVQANEISYGFLSVKQLCTSL